MKKLTLGQKITAGFGGLILLAALLGGMAVLSMKSVETLAKKLAGEYVQESEIAEELQAAVSEVRLSVRSYGFTTDPSYMDETRKGLEVVHKFQQEAQKLANEHPDLVKLRENLKQIDASQKAFEDLIQQTEAKAREIVAGREKLNRAAADFIANIDKLIASQHTKLEAEIKSFTEAPKLHQRATKLMLATEIRDEGNAARIAVFKSQALRDPQLIDAGLKGFTVMDQKFDELLAMLQVQEDIAELNRVKADAHTYRDAMKEIMSDYLALADISTKRLTESERLTKLVDETGTTGMKRTVEAANLSSQKLATASVTMLIGLALAITIGAGIAFFITRNTNRTLHAIADALGEGSAQVSSAATQVASASQGLAEGASEQAASLEETSSSLEEMASMTKRNSESAMKASDLTKQTSAAADKGTADMRTMIAAMDGIKVSSDETAKIIKTIDEIAFQTNILALNAAVEAARAGEAGMGFAVVADEVRNLAQRSALAAKETATKIEGSLVRTAQGVEISAKVAASLDEITARIREVDALVASVSTASREQTEGITQINLAVSQMDTVTQSNAANAEESASAAEELNAQAEVMNQSVGELLRMVGGESPDHGHTHAHAAPATVHRVSRAAKPAKPIAAEPHHNGHANGKPAPAGAVHSRGGDIPMAGDFKDF